MQMYAVYELATGKIMYLKKSGNHALACQVGDGNSCIMIDGEIDVGEFQVNLTTLELESIN